MTAKIINLQRERIKRRASASTLDLIDRLSGEMAYALATRVDKETSGLLGGEANEPSRPTMLKTNKEEIELVP